MVDNKCLAAERGNCCSAMAGEGYCLYHKPNKSKKETIEFYKKLKEQGRTETDETGKESLVFNDNADWNGYVFPSISFKGASLEGATFKGSANFEEATFEGRASFEAVTFTDDANFYSTIFKGWAFYEGATFKCAHYEGATFEKGVYFNDATFIGNANFYSTNFKGRTYFRDAIFKGEANFWETTFESIANFWGTTFKGEADFDAVTFEDSLTFKSATFEGGAYFRDASFEGKVIYVGGTCIKEILFEGALFERTCIFTNRKFYGKLKFTNAEFRQGVVMEIDWEKPEPEKYRVPQAEKEGCRVQRIAYEKEGRKDAADAMFVREMRASRRDRAIQYKNNDGKLTPHSKPLWDSKKPLLRKFCWYNLRSHLSSKAEYLLVDLSSQYGTSWQRLIHTALGLIVLFACVYLIGAHLSSTHPLVGGIYSAQPTAIELFVNLEPGNEAITVESKKRDIVLVKNFINLLYFSVNAFIPVGYGDMYPVGLMKYVAGIQPLIGAFYIALFVVVFARKWMR